jgi:iron-sulfur cluster repair protein YtfE (RIC family)
MTFAHESDQRESLRGSPRTALEESMDVIEMLTNDHNKVRELFKAFKGGGGVTGLLRRTVGEVTGAERRKVVEQVCTELEVHTLVEEEIFYPAVRALGDRELLKQVNEALKEHSRVKKEVASLREKHDDVDSLEQRMSQLEEDVEHHATEEEDEMFPRLDELMPDEERRELARRMQALKEKAAAFPSGDASAARGGQRVASR